MSQTTLVVPCFNEAKRLRPDIFATWASTHAQVRFLMVDDGSKDNTRAVLQELQQGKPESFLVLGLDVNGGKAEAVRRGILHAWEAKSAYVGFWDADLATPLDSLDEFVAVLDTHPSVDMVLGSRVQLLGRNIERDRRRHYFGRIAATGVSAMLGLRVYVTQCGAKLFRVTPAMRGLFEEEFITRWVFDVEILARWIRQNRGLDRRELERRVHELPLQRWMDVKGSRLRPSDFVKAPLELARIWAHYFGPLAS
jgi:glycosyltransferase involved in cell wall biosynthesis